jgi:hypothetical protein
MSTEERPWTSGTKMMMLPVGTQWVANCAAGFPSGSPGPTRQRYSGRRHRYWHTYGSAGLTASTRTSKDFLGQPAESLYMQQLGVGLCRNRHHDSNRGISGGKLRDIASTLLSMNFITVTLC